MIADLLTRLVRPTPDPLSDSDARLALVSLLVRIAKSDGSYAQAERDTILRISQKRFCISDSEAVVLLTEAEDVEAQAPDTVRFTRAIKDAVAYEDRLGVIEALWDVVLADGVRDPEEDALLRLAASLLGVSDRDSHAVRLKVSAR